MEKTINEGFREISTKGLIEEVMQISCELAALKKHLDRVIDDMITLHFYSESEKEAEGHAA